MNNQKNSKINSQVCTQCGASMKIKVIGDMQDKVWSCAYCDHVIDIIDSYSTKEEEEIDNFIDEAGNTVTKKTTIIKHRIDGKYNGTPEIGALNFGKSDPIDLKGFFSSGEDLHLEFKNRFNVEGAIMFSPSTITGSTTTSEDIDNIDDFKAFLLTQTEINPDDVENIIHNFDMTDLGGEKLYSGTPLDQKVFTTSLRQEIRTDYMPSIKTVEYPKSYLLSSYEDDDGNFHEVVFESSKNSKGIPKPVFFITVIIALILLLLLLASE